MSPPLMARHFLSSSLSHYQQFLLESGDAATNSWALLLTTAHAVHWRQPVRIYIVLRTDGLEGNFIHLPPAPNHLPHALRLLCSCMCSFTFWSIERQHFLLRYLHLLPTSTHNLLFLLLSSRSNRYEISFDPQWWPLYASYLSFSVFLMPL